MSGLYNQIMRGVNSVSKEVFKDDQMVVSLTWKVFSKASFDRELRKNVELFIIHPAIPAVKVQKKINSMNTLNLPTGIGGLVTGELEYMLELKNAPDEMSYRDLIIEDGVTYGIDKIHKIMKRFVIVAVKGIE
jgi:hypothetical protein